MASARVKAKEKVVVESPKDRHAQDQRFQNIESWLEDLNGQTGELNDWELGFLESVGDRFTTMGELSDGQFQKLKQIWEKHC